MIKRNHMTYKRIFLLFSALIVVAVLAVFAADYIQDDDNGYMYDWQIEAAMQELLQEVEYQGIDTVWYDYDFGGYDYYIGEAPSYVGYYGE